jgi:hypothetical protein
MTDAETKAWRRARLSASGKTRGDPLQVKAAIRSNIECADTTMTGKVSASMANCAREGR